MEKGNGLPLNLSRPAQRAFTNAGIISLKQLSKFSEIEITKLHGVGPDAIKKIKLAFIGTGMSFADK